MEIMEIIGVILLVLIMFPILFLLGLLLSVFRGIIFYFMWNWFLVGTCSINTHITFWDAVYLAIALSILVPTSSSISASTTK